MSSIPQGLPRIKVQTARMLEIFALLQQELRANNRHSLSPSDLDRLSRAIATIRSNMILLQVNLDSPEEKTSPSAAENRALEELLKEVLDWVLEKNS